jgi:transcriptional regulator with XRE-family HTH domain
MQQNPQALRLGQYLRQKRRALGLSTQEVANRSGVNRAHLVRIESGTWTPKPETLKAVAKALDLDLADVWTVAGFREATELPAPMLYLRAKYRDLPESTIAALSRDVAKVLEEHGLTGEGLKGDEPGDASTASSLRGGTS